LFSGNGIQSSSRSLSGFRERRTSVWWVHIITVKTRLLVAHVLAVSIYFVAENRIGNFGWNRTIRMQKAKRQ